MGELSGGNLKPDLRKLGGVVFAKIVDEIVLDAGKIDLTLLLEAPFLIATVCFPIGDVPAGELEVWRCLCI